MRSSGGCLLCRAQPRARGLLFRRWSPRSLWNFGTLAASGCSSPLSPRRRARSDALVTVRLLTHGRDQLQALLPGPSGPDTVLILKVTVDEIKIAFSGLSPLSVALRASNS